MLETKFPWKRVISKVKVGISSVPSLYLDAEIQHKHLMWFKARVCTVFWITFLIETLLISPFCCSSSQCKKSFLVESLPKAVIPKNSSAVFTSNQGSPECKLLSKKCDVKYVKEFRFARSHSCNQAQVHCCVLSHLCSNGTPVLKILKFL